MFIDSGPIGLIHFRNNTTEIIKDSNRGMIYSGPMVVLINGFSASASELFTNAMQDYKRAVVVGQKSFGKATMQQIFPIDNKNSQFLKITKEEFYNITGKTNQYRGIKPDVEIPLLFQNQIDGEKDEETAIENDSINVKIKYTTSKKSTINKAIEKVIKTFPNDTIIQETTAFNTEIDAIYDNDLPSVALNFDSVFSEVNRISKLWKKLETFSEKTFDINIENNSFDKENQLFDTFLKSYNEERIKAIKTNYSIYQAVKVCNELIKNNR
jgi:carboxyl-terminal processing protease